jgi:signal transduction histidine kinase
VAAVFLLVKGLLVYLLIVVPVIIYLLMEFFSFFYKGQKEMNQFVESIHYRDFTGHFDIKHAPAELQPLRKGFNQINTTFKEISKEKEASHQYLQKILELVDTGILSYDIENGEVIWLNESLKKMLELPYLKTVHSLMKRDEELYKKIISIKPSESKVATAHLESRSFKILICATVFKK